MKRVLRAQSDFKKTTLRNQLTSLILYEVAVCSASRARALEAFTNRFFNNVKLGDLAARKKAHQILLDKNAINKTFEEILPRYKPETTTFVRSLRTKARLGDDSPRKAIMLLEGVKVETKETKKPAKAVKEEG